MLNTPPHQFKGFTYVVYPQVKDLGFTQNENGTK